VIAKIPFKIANIFGKRADKTGQSVVCTVKNELTRSPGKDVILFTKREFCKNFLANNPQVENVIKKANFEQYGQNGLPLKYPRKDFIRDFNGIIKDLETDNKNELFQKLGMTAKFNEQGTFISYEGFPKLENLDSRIPLNQKISSIVNKFTQENEVITKDLALNKTMNSVLKEFPEYANVIGKKQHNDTQLYSVDCHILKVLKEAINHPEYKKLSDKDKTVMKMSILFHDIAKIEGEVDKGHQNISAIYTKELVKRISMPQEMKDRLFELVKNHHWLEEYNLDLTRPENIGKMRATPEDIAARFRRPGDYSIAKIFAEADLKGVNNHFFKKYGEALCAERQEPIEKALKNIHNTGNVIMTSRIVTPSKIPQTRYRGKIYKVLNFTKISDHCDLEKFGFVRGTKKDDLRFLTHFLRENNLLNTVSGAEAVSDVAKGAAFSTSLFSLKNKMSFCNEKFGFIFNTENSNLAAALNRDMESGEKKNFKEFLEYIHSEMPSRAFLNEKIIETLTPKYKKITDDEYGELFKQIMDKKHITQIKDVNIGKRTIKSDDLKFAIKKAQDELFNISTGQDDRWNEVVVYNPKISAVICKKDSIKNVPQTMLDFANSRKLPIVLVGE